MCSPTLALTALTTVASFAGQSADAKAQQATLDNHERRTRDEAERSYALQTTQEGRALAEKAVANSREVTESNTRRAEAAATAKTAAGEAGVTGLSLDALLGDYSRKQAAYKDAVDQQFEFDTLASRDTNAGLQAQRDSRINGSIASTVKKPSFLELAITNIAPAALKHGEKKGYF